MATYAPNLEQVLIVDAQNRPVGRATRQEMRQRNLPHRATYIFVANSEKQLYVQRRTRTKDIYPGYFDFAPGGVVLASDPSDMESARRELEEEMGIQNGELEHLFDFYYENERSKVWGASFLTQWDGPVRLQPEEVESVRLMSLSEIAAELAAGVPFCPDSVVALQQFLQLGKLS